jgi:DNA-binding SARP family transcriptional activator/tetratricopeptide (TPR) repeat protein
MQVRGNSKTWSIQCEGRVLVEFRILGPVRVGEQAGLADLRSVKLRALLADLLLHVNAPVQTERLIDRLWEEEDQPPDARKKVQMYVSRARGVLKKVKSTAQLVTRHGQYVLLAEPGNVDYYRFRQLVGEGRNAAKKRDPRRVTEILGKAVDLWQDEPLADVHIDWARRTRQTMILQDLHPAYRTWFDAHLAMEHHDFVAARVRRLLEEHETDESFAALYMRAIAVAGDTGSLARFYEQFTARLKREFGAEPQSDLATLYRRLLDEQPRADSYGPSPTRVVRRPRPGQLPRDTPYFLDREDIMRRLDTLLTNPGSTAVVALDGGPGFGKSALATHWARSRRHHFPDGDLYYNLRGYGSQVPAKPATVLAYFLDSVGVSPKHMPMSVEERVALLRSTLTGYRMLITLDNARDSEHVRPLLAATAPCPVLITSRQQLSALSYHEGAHHITVPTFLIEDSIALLLRRIGDTRADLKMPALHDLASLCDGLPLALRIAGEHVAARPQVPIEELVEHLRRRLLDAGSHGDGGSSTLRAMFAWSCDALPGGTDRLFRLLGLHPSVNVSAPAAAAIAGLSEDEAEHELEKLLGAHLVQQQTGESYRIHDLLHRYAADRMRDRESPEGRKNAVHRMVDWYLGTVINAIRKVAPQLPEVPQLRLTTRVVPRSFLDDEEAMRWSVRERTQILGVSRLAAEFGFHEHMWRIIGIFGEVLNRYGDPHDLIEIHRLALKSARIAGSLYGEAAHLNNLGYIYLNLDEYAEAEQYFRKSRALCQETENVIGEAAALHNMGYTYHGRGDFRAAIKLYEQGLALFVKASYEEGQARAHLRLGDAHRALGRPDSAIAHYRDELRIRKRIGHIGGQGEALSRLSELYLEQGDAESAMRHCEEALAVHRRARDQRKTADTLRVKAAIHYSLGEHGDVVSCAREAAVLSQESGDLRGKAHSLYLAGKGQNALRDISEAHSSWEAALELFEELGDPCSEKVRGCLEKTEPQSQGLIPGPRSVSAPMDAERGPRSPT